MPNGAKYWCYTSFHLDPDEEGYDDVTALAQKGVIQYRICQLEVCPDTKRIHEQGYIVLSKRMTMSKLKEFMPSAHFEMRKGTHEEAVRYFTEIKTQKHYCKKPVPNCICVHCTTHPPEMTVGEWMEFGDDSDVPLFAGERTDWKKIVQLAKEGKFEQIEDEYPAQMLHCAKGIKEIYERHDKPRDPSIPVEVEVYWGAPGTGKSKAAYKKNPGAWMKSDMSTKWYDGYKGEQVIILNDFRGYNLKFSKLLNLLDRYPQRVEKKGGSIELKCNKFIITTNPHPSKWYPSFKWDDENPLRRRITRIVEFKKNNNTQIHKPVELEWDEDAQDFVAKKEEVINFME